MSRRLDKTLVDYLVIAVNPVLIMLMIGSLLFFLLEVFYQGQYEGRLKVIFALFVAGAVLIGRIAIEEGRERAEMFAGPLAVVTYLALLRFVRFHGTLVGGMSWLANLLLIGLVWGCAHKLTRNCTEIDELEGATGEGLLDGDSPNLRGLGRENGTVPLGPDEPEGTTSRDGTSKPGWWQRLVEYDRRPHAPGVWIVYVSLVALPIFGFGQLLAPASGAAGRGSMFFLLWVYVASGMGLLMNTSFLGLRRYLRQRRVEMPDTMAGLWLAVGSALILGLLTVASLLPRPNAGYALADLSFHLDSPERSSSKIAVGRDGADRDRGGPRTGANKTRQTSGPGAQGNARNGTGRSNIAGTRRVPSAEAKTDTADGTRRVPATGAPNDAPANSQGSEQGRTSGSASGEGKDSQAAQSPSRSQQPSRSGSQGKSGDSASRSQDRSQDSTSSSQGKSETSASKSRPGRREPDRAPNDRGKNDSTGRPDAGQQADAKQRPDAGQQSGPRQETDAGQRTDTEQEADARDPADSEHEGNRERSPSGRWDSDPQKDQYRESQDTTEETQHGESASQSTFRPGVLVQTVGGFAFGLVKWIVFLGMLVFGVYCAWRSREELLRMLREFLERWREFWAKLFGGTPVSPGAPSEPEEPTENRRKPFCDYADPFLSGGARGWLPDAVIAYTFEALEAWAHERECTRNPEQTPREFARQLADRFPELSSNVGRLADLYCETAYAPRTVPEDNVEPLRDLWAMLRQQPAAIP
jgi:hypothetical protein